MIRLPRHHITAVALLSATLTVTPAMADDPVTITPDPNGAIVSVFGPGGGYLAGAGYVKGQGVPMPPRATADGGGDRSTTASCAYRAVSAVGGNVLLSVTGVATATGRPRAAITEVGCRIIDSTGQIAVDVDRSESGALALQNSDIVVRNGPFGVCAQSTAQYDDGEIIIWPGPTAADMLCVLP